jgi:polar amino acid transport system substrate-binding protein
MTIRSLLAACLWSLASVSALAQPIQVVTEATPYSYLRDGKVVGAATELVELSLRRAGLNDHTVTIYPWARAYDLALNQPNVLIYMIARTPAREPQFRWVGEFMRIEYHLYKLRERSDIVVRSLADARNYSIGAMRDDVRHQYLQAQGFTKVVLSAHNIDNFRKLLARQVQLIPLPEGDAHALCKETGFDCRQLERVHTLDELSVGLYMAFGSATPDATFERLRESFAKIRADGTVKRVMEAVKP